MTPAPRRTGGTGPTAARGAADVHVALLRGVNVGRAKRIAMADLRALVASLGFGDVRTLLNSGNVVYRATGVAAGAAAARLEVAIASTNGVSTRATVLTAAELDAIVAANPWPDPPDASRLLVTFLTDPADLARLEPLAAQAWGSDRLGFGPRAAYAWCPDGMLESRLAAAMAKVLRDGATARNWATVRKLHALAAADG